MGSHLAGAVVIEAFTSSQPVQQASPPAITLTGRRPQEVLDVIRQRRNGTSRNDGCRVALVVEGGAMRGVYTAGALLALHGMGFAKSFDDAYGTSAGAVNVAHFLSGQGHLKVDTYYRLLADGRFLNFARLHKMVDIDFFVDEVLTRLRPVEVERIMQSPTRFWVAVGDYLTAKQQLIHVQSCPFPLLQVLKATTAMPVLYNQLVTLGEIQAFDVGFCSPFPLPDALAQGATHVLVLLANPVNHTSLPEKWWERGLVRYRFARKNPAVRKLFTDSAVVCNRLRDVAHGHSHSDSPAAIATIAPAQRNVRHGTQNVQTLRAALIETARATFELFGHDPSPLQAWIESGTI